jgi:hypothetical protein
MEDFRRGARDPGVPEPSETDTIVRVAAAVAGGFIRLPAPLRIEVISNPRPEGARLRFGQRSRRARRRLAGVLIIHSWGPGLTHAILRHHAPSVLVRFTSRPRTVGDCFRCRKRMGINATTPLPTETHRMPVPLVDSIRQTAEVCRARTLHRPLLEAMAR